MVIQFGWLSSVVVVVCCLVLFSVADDVFFSSLNGTSFEEYCRFRPPLILTLERVYINF